MSNANDFVIENGLLIKYIGKNENVTVPDGVTKIAGNACALCAGVEIHLPASVTEIEWKDPDYSIDRSLPQGTFGAQTTVFAPTGSVAEREIHLSRTPNFINSYVDFQYRFVPEGEALIPDDSDQRKERSFNEWRDITTSPTGRRVRMFPFFCAAPRWRTYRIFSGNRRLRQLSRRRFRRIPPFFAANGCLQS